MSIPSTVQAILDNQIKEHWRGVYSLVPVHSAQTRLGRWAFSVGSGWYVVRFDEFGEFVDSLSMLSEEEAVEFARVCAPHLNTLPEGKSPLPPKPWRELRPRQS